MKLIDTKDRIIELLHTSIVLKGVELAILQGRDIGVWLEEQYAEIDSELEYLNAVEDKILETANEVKGEL